MESSEQQCEVLKQLMESYGLNQHSCNLTISDEDLNSISDSCCAGGAWKSLAVPLEIKNAVAVTQDIDKMQIEDGEKRRNFFYKWRQMKGHEATYMRLAKVLLKIEHRLDAGKVLKLLQGTTASSPQPTPTELSPPTDTGKKVYRWLCIMKHGLPHAGTPVSDPTALPSDIRRDLRQQLRFNLNEIKTKYTFFVECIRTSVHEKHVSVKDLRAFLLSQSVFDYDDDDYKLFSDTKEDLYKADDVDEIFNLLNTEYASFLNYEVFLLLVDKYKLNEGQKELEYPKALREYINKQKISEFIDINPALTIHTDNSKVITLKLDIKPTSKLAKVKELSDAIADKMKWHPSSVRILGIDKGCVEVKLLIPASLADHVFTGDDIFTASKKQEFEKLEILWLKCNDHTYYFKNKNASQVC